MLTACLTVTHFPARCELQRRLHDNSGNDGARLPPIIVFDATGVNVVDAMPDLHVRRGDPLESARARYPGALAVAEDRDHYSALWTATIKKLMAVADRVEDAKIGCAYIALDGLQQMHGSRSELIDAVMRAAPEWMSPRLGVAHSKFHALCAAVAAQPGLPNVLPSSLEVAVGVVAAMPVGMLPLEPRQVLMLHDFGIFTMGELAAQPMSAIQAQLGYAGKCAWELANGIDTAPLVHVEHSSSVAQSMQFQWPVVSIDALKFGIQAVMQDAFNSPIRGDRSVRRIDVALNMEDYADWRLSRTFKEPIGKSTVAAQRVTEAIEAALSKEPSPMQGPINAINVALSKLGAARSEQGVLWSEERAGDIRTAIRQLTARSDIPALTKVVEVEPWSRIPERRQALAPVTVP